jgi:hypothetical protein
MADLLPLTPDMVIATDAEREMVDYVVGRVMRHRKDWGEPPDTIAIVTESSKGRTPHSFSLKPDSDRLATCAAAAALLLHRGTAGD